MQHFHWMNARCSAQALLPHLPIYQKQPGRDIDRIGCIRRQLLDATDTIQTYMTRTGLLFPQAVGKSLQDVAAGTDLDPYDYQYDASVMLTAPGWAKAMTTPEVTHLARQVRCRLAPVMPVLGICRSWHLTSWWAI